MKIRLSLTSTGYLNVRKAVRIKRFNQVYFKETATNGAVCYYKVI